jgi:ATP-dependent Zn protease
MVDKLGAVNYTQEEGFSKPFSEKTGKIIDDEIQKIIQH